MQCQEEQSLSWSDTAHRLETCLAALYGAARSGVGSSRHATGQSDQDQAWANPAAHRPSDKLPFAAS